MANDYTWTFTTATVGTYFKVPDTNQSLCYDTFGNVISCVGTGQDGDYLIEVPGTQYFLIISLLVISPSHNHIYKVD